MTRENGGTSVGDFKLSIHASIVLGSNDVLEVGTHKNLPAVERIRRLELGKKELAFAAFAGSQLREFVVVVLKGLAEIVNPTLINPVEIASDGGAGGGAVDNLVAAFHGGLEGGGIAYVPYHHLHRPRKHLLQLPIGFPHQRLKLNYRLLMVKFELEAQRNNKSDLTLTV